MDKIINEPVLGVAVITVIVVFLALRHRKKISLINNKKNSLKSLYKREVVFLCDDVTNVGGDFFHFYGEPFGGSVRPGMKISDPIGVEYTIKEVFVDTNTSLPKVRFAPFRTIPKDDTDKSDLEIPNGVKGIILIETNIFDWQSFRQNLKNEKVVALKLH